MEKLDLALLIILCLGIIWGFVSGVISMLISVLCFLIGMYILPDYIRAFSAERELVIIHSQITYYILFAIAIVLCLIVGKVLSSLISKMLKLMLLGGVNRALGALVGLVLAVFVCAVIVKSGSQFPSNKPFLSQETIVKSKSAAFFLGVSKLFPLEKVAKNTTQSTTE